MVTKFKIFESKYLDWEINGKLFVPLHENSNSDIDPYGEEDWNDYLSMLKDGDKFIVTSPMIVYKNFHRESKLNKGDVIYYVGQIHSRRQNYIRYIFTDDITSLNDDCEFELELDDFANIKNIDIVKESLNSEMDPYGEDDDDEPKYNIGDIIDVSDKLYGKIIDIDYETREYTVNYYKKGPYINTNIGYGYIDEYKIKGLLKESLKLENMNESITPDKVKAAVNLIKNTIKNTEWEGKVFIAGGAVRDEIMGNDPKDVDLLINVPDGGILFANWITKELGIHTKGNPVIYPRFGTAKFDLRRQIYDGENLSDVDIECVMPRKEVYKKGDRKPDVYQGSLKDDVDRRDFTVNSLLKDLSSGEILDLTGMGKQDIKDGIVRTPMDPDVIFDEDPLRMLRAIRFSIKYNWKLPMFMLRSLRKNAKKLQYISSERIHDELNKMLLTKNPDKAIKLLQILGLSKYIFPELDKLIRMKQNKHHKYDAMRHTLEVLKNTPPDLITRLSALFHDIGKGKTKEIIDNEVHFYKHELVGSHMVRDIMKRLHYPKDIIDSVAIAVGEHMRTKQSGDTGEITDRSLRKLKQDLGPHLQHTLDLIHADNISHSDDSNMPNQVPNIRRRFDELELKEKELPKKSPLSGDDVMDILGIGKGPIVGKILKVLGDMYLDDPSMSREELTEVVKNLYKEI